MRPNTARFIFVRGTLLEAGRIRPHSDRKSTRLNSSHDQISYAVFCLKKKKQHDHIRSHQRSRQRMFSTDKGAAPTASLAKAKQRSGLPSRADELERSHLVYAKLR